MLDRTIKIFERLAVIFAYIGAAIIFVQMVWISYGVMMRYVFSSPDGTVTEATALLLFPVAFLGLAFALKEDAYPKVSYMIDATKGRARTLVLALNYALMLGVGAFFSVAAVRATYRSFYSGASSEILLWPRYLFWAPGAAALVLFTLYTALLLLALFMRGETNEK
jgi:TRAP-type C4-dicarboxylate transport system permease small subunit